jgi:hypothetical protein
MAFPQFCCSLAAALLLCGVSLAADSHHWPFRIEGRLPERDITAIASVISHTKNIDRHIVWMEIKTPTEVWVFTGKIIGVQQGGGDGVTVRKRGGKWIADDSSWSWVL